MAGKWWDGWYDPEEQKAPGQTKHSSPDAAKKAAYEQALGRTMSDEDWMKIQSRNREMHVTGGNASDKTIGVNFDRDADRGVEAASRFYAAGEPAPAAQPKPAAPTGQPPWAPPPAQTYSGFEGTPGGSAASGYERPGMNALYDQPGYKKPGGPDTYTDPKTGKVIEMGSSAQSGFEAKAMAPYENAKGPMKAPLGPDPFAPGYYGGAVKDPGLGAPTHYQFEPDKIAAKPPPQQWSAAPETPKGYGGPAPAPVAGSHFSKAEDPWSKDMAQLDAIEKKYSSKPADDSWAQDNAKLDAVEKKYAKKPSFGKAVAKKKAG